MSGPVNPYVGQPVILSTASLLLGTDTNGRLKNKHPSDVNVLDWGLLGDNSTLNDTAAAAMLAATPDGSTYYFPAGIYKFSAVLDFFAAGKTIVGLRGDCDNSSGLLNNSVILGTVLGPLVRMYEKGSSGSCYVQGLQFYNGHTLGMGLMARDQNNLIIKKCTFNGHLGLTVSSASGAVFACKFNGGNFGTYDLGMVSAGVSLTDCDVTSYSGEGVRLYGTGCNRVTGGRYEVNNIAIRTGYDDLWSQSGSIAAISLSSNTITVTTGSANYLLSGQSVTLATTGMTNVDGTYTVVTVLSPTQFTVTGSAPSGSYAGGGAWSTGLLGGINAISLSGNTVSVTTGAVNALVTGQTVIINSAGMTNVDGMWSITVTDTTHFSYTASSTPSGSYTIGGTWAAFGVRWSTNPVEIAGMTFESNGTAILIDGLGGGQLHVHALHITGFLGTVQYAIRVVSQLNYAVFGPFDIGGGFQTASISFEDDTPSTQILWIGVYAATSTTGAKAWNIRGSRKNHTFLNSNYTDRADDGVTATTLATDLPLPYLLARDNVYPTVQGKNLRGKNIAVTPSVSSMAVTFNAGMTTITVNASGPTTGGSLSVTDYYYVCEMVTPRGCFATPETKVTVTGGNNAVFIRFTGSGFPPVGEFAARFYRGTTPGKYDVCMEFPYCSSSGGALILDVGSVASSFPSGGLDSAGQWCITSASRGPNASTAATDTIMSEPDTNYGIVITPGWSSTVYCAVADKLTTGFTAHFGTASPAASGGGSISGLAFPTPVGNNVGPVQITTSGAHGLATGQAVTIASVGGCTAANGTWNIDVISSTKFLLRGSQPNAAWTSGGTWAIAPTMDFVIVR